MREELESAVADDDIWSEREKERKERKERENEIRIYFFMEFFLKEGAKVCTHLS